ncbi:MAG TPA: polyprenyl synthetase family protein [Alkalispirochaeta sp.]|nr:polyprenyl synthetase family protein [Alkalispirochaeta sp.]
MNTYLTEARGLVAQHLTDYLAHAQQKTLTFQPWGPDVAHRINEYALRGKMIRGALVGFSYRLFHPEGEVPQSCIEAGAAMELLQSFLLIHDDIMDQDEVRRGGPAIHAQYAAAAPDDEATAQYGLSLGICVGDVSAFLAMERLATMDEHDSLRNRIVALVAREISLVGLAQMQDVHHGYVDEADDQEIMNVYTYKTGRYTFSLPLMIGAILAGADDASVEGLARFGEHAGRIFQIRDDQLGLLGAGDRIGKPEGSDIREDKKTPFRNALMSCLPSDSPVRNSFGAKTLSATDINAVREALEYYGIQDAVEDSVARDERSARAEIAALTLSPEGTRALEELLNYNLKRTV